MNLEKTVVELTDTINHTGLNEQVIEERELYLCLLAATFINITEQKKYNNFLISLLECSSDQSWNKSLSQKLQKINFSCKSHHTLYQELLKRLTILSDEKRELLLSKTSFLISSDLILKITKLDAVTIYSHVLQRLQAMNVVNKLSFGFQYQDIPTCFSNLTRYLVSNPNLHSIYDPYAMTGELAIYYALNCNIELVTTETVLQTSSYLSHLFCIAGVSDIKALHSYGLSQVPNIPSNTADVAFTLLDPSASREKENQIIENQDSMENVEEDSVKAGIGPRKYKEHAFIQHILYSLKSDGLGVIFLGKGPLHREAETDARKYLLNNNFVEAVIELPSKLITPKTITLYALIIKKTRTHQLIKFIDASNYFEAAGRRNKLSKLEEISKLYNSSESINGLVSVRTVEEVLANGALLSPSSYLSDYETTNSAIDLKKVRKQLAEQENETDYKLRSIFKDFYI